MRAAHRAGGGAGQAPRSKLDGGGPEPIILTINTNNHINTNTKNFRILIIPIIGNVSVGKQGRRK